MVLKPARYVDEQEDVEFGEILVFAGAEFLITVRHRPASALGDVRRRMEADPQMLALGPTAVLHAVVDRVVDDYLPVVAGLEKDIHEVEAQVFSASRENPAERIYKLKREVLEFQLASAPLREPLDRLARRRVAGVPEELAEYFRDVQDHLVRVVEQVVSFREAADQHPGGQPDPGRRSPERGCAQDIGLGRNRGGAHDDRRHLRHELPEYA